MSTELTYTHNSAGHTVCGTVHSLSTVDTSAGYTVCMAVHLLSLEGERDSVLPLQPQLVLRHQGQHDRNALIGHAVVEEGGKVQTLQKLPLPHEPGQRRRPALGQHLQPLGVQLVKCQLGQAARLLASCS